jgi:hypothetical protein
MNPASMSAVTTQSTVSRVLYSVYKPSLSFLSAKVERKSVYTGFPSSSTSKLSQEIGSTASPRRS